MPLGNIFMNVRGLTEKRRKIGGKTEKISSLPGRSCELLKEIIQAYIETGYPIGSRFLSKRSRCGLSAASIRNVMADLEEAGYLHQPHNSAGRLPTDKGYRFYVDTLMEKRHLPDSEQDRIQVGMQKESVEGPDKLMDYTSRLLSRLSDNVGIVLAPSLSKTVLQHIHFLRLTANRVLAIIVGNSGLVQNRIVCVVEDFSQDELDRAGQFLSREFAEKTLPVIRKELEQILSEERSCYDPWWKKLPALCAQSFQEESPHAIYIDGTTRLIRHPEFSDMSRVRDLFETFEHREELVGIISQCIKDESCGVHIWIGKEMGISGIQDCALITSSYQYGKCPAGSIGILGPTRLEYSKAVCLVDFIARLFGTILSHS